MADGGARSIESMTESAVRDGVDIRLGYRVQRTIIDDGRVVGVQATSTAGETISVLARKAVIFATGYRPHLPYLRSLGAAEVVDRRELSEEAGRPLQSQRFAAAVDGVGSTTLANVLAQTAWGGTVAAFGLVRTAPPPQADITADAAPSLQSVPDLVEGQPGY